ASLPLAGSFIRARCDHRWAPSCVKVLGELGRTAEFCIRCGVERNAPMMRAGDEVRDTFPFDHEEARWVEICEQSSGGIGSGAQFARYSYARIGRGGNYPTFADWLKARKRA